MAGFGIWWAPFPDGHPYTRRMGIEGEQKLPVLLEWDTYQALKRGEEFDYRIENLIFGMLIMLEPYPQQLVPFEPKHFVAALKELGNSCGDPSCERMIALAYRYMLNEHSAEDAKSIGKIARMYFGIDYHYAGDN